MIFILGIVRKYVFLKKGQSLIEILVAIAIGIVMIGVAIAIIAPVLKSNTRTNEAKIGGMLGRELLENVKVFAERDWHNIDTLATTSLWHYYLVTSTVTGFFATSTGDESTTIATTTYTRYFYVDDVCRDASDKIPDDAMLCVTMNDPATKKVTVVYKWPDSATNTFATYLTRFKSRITAQTDWQKGTVPVNSSPVTTTTNSFATSSNIIYASSSGVIKIRDVVPL